MPMTMSRRKQSNPKPLKTDSDVDEAMDTSSVTPTTSDPTREQVGVVDRGSSRSSSPGAPPPPVPGHHAVGCVSPRPSGLDIAAGIKKRGAAVEWPVKKGSLLGPFSARIEPVQEECDRENSICVRGTSGSIFSIFILEYYCQDVLSKTSVKPAPKQGGSKAALVYIYKPDKQLYLLTLKDISEQEHIPSVFLEGGQDRHPGSHEVDDLVAREVNAGHRAVIPLENQHATDGPNSQATIMTIPSLLKGVKESMEVRSVSCQSCGVTFRNPANLSAHQLYYCAARETTPVPPATRTHPPRHQSRETYVPDQTPSGAETEQPDDLVCILCKAKFTNLTNCLSHMVKLHAEQNSQACKCCNFCSSDIKLLKEHMLIHVRGSGINTNVFMASQGVFRPVGPLTVHGVKDRRLEEKRAKKKSHQMLNNKMVSVDYQGSSPQREASVMSNGLGISYDATLRNTENNGGSSPHSPNANKNSSPLRGEVKTSPSASPRNHSEDNAALVHPTSDFQTRPVGRFLCVECDIYFSSHKNFTAHKQFYCQGHSKERTKPIQVPNQPAEAPPPLPFVQCEGCTAVFPSRDKLAVHTLYFCQYRKTDKSGSGITEETAGKSSDSEPAHPSTSAEGGKACVEKDYQDEQSMEVSSGELKIKVEKTEEQPSGKALNLPNGEIKGDTTPTSTVHRPEQSSGVSPGPVYISSGNVPTYVGQQGASPVYILASHVFVTPPGTSASSQDKPASSPPYYSKLPSVVPAVRGLSPRGENGTSIPGERPLDLSVRKRKGSEEIVKQEGSASKMIKHVNGEGTVIPAQPEQSSPTSKIPAPFMVPNVQGQIQYKCPGCHITFHRYESLDVHRQFYCQSSNGQGSENQIQAARSSSSTEVLPSLPAIPYYQIISSSAPSGSTLVPALATVQLRDNPSRPVSRGSEIGRSSSRDGTVSSPSSQTMGSIISSGKPLAISEQGRNSDKCNSLKAIGSESQVRHAMARHSPGRGQAGVESSSSGHSRRSASTSPSQRDTLQGGIAFPMEQNGEAGDPNGQKVAMYVPSVVRYMCPACGVSFMKLESLSAHQQFYCRASQAERSVDRTSPESIDNAKSPSPAESMNGLPFAVSNVPILSPINQRQEHGMASQDDVKAVSVASRNGSDTLPIETKRPVSNGVEDLPERENVAPGALTKKNSEDSGNESKASSSETEQEETVNSGSGQSGEGFLAVKVKQEKDLNDGACFRETESACDVENTVGGRHIKQEMSDVEEHSCTNGKSAECPSWKEDGTFGPLAMHNGHHDNGRLSPRDGRDRLQPSDSTSPRSPAASGSQRHGDAAGTGRSVAPVMMKHCRACNISFSSLSTFIAHKKYYCASHHVAKSTVR